MRVLTYRLGRIRELTGADPAHRCMLRTAVIGTPLLGRPAKEL
ncbi:hypothetical protein [Streptomyces sp. NBC_01485]